MEEKKEGGEGVVVREREYNLVDWQNEVWYDEHRFKVLNIGRRGGKTLLSVLKMASEGMSEGGTMKTRRGKPMQIWYVAPTYKQAKQIAWQMLHEVIPEVGIWKQNEQDLTIQFKHTRAQLFLKGADNPASLRGNRIDLLILDEVAFFKDWDNVWAVLRPTLMDSKGSAWFISTPDGFNHFYDLYKKELVDDDYKTFHYTTYDNPHIAFEEIEKERDEMDADVFAQEHMGEFRKMSGLIYKEFDPKVHMVDIPSSINSNWTFTRSIDFGYSHATALVYLAISPEGSEIYAYDGLYESGLVTSEIAEVVRVKDSGRYITGAVADSAQPMTIEELGRLGARFSAIKKGADSVNTGIVKVKELLKVRNDTGRPTMMFSKNLGWIQDEFMAYRWMESKRDGMVKQVPFKKGDDAMDAIRYFASNYRKREAVNPNAGYMERMSRVDSW